MAKKREGVMLSDDLAFFHANRVCYCHEYIGDGTKYEYTYQTKGSKYDIASNNEFQLTLFDF